MSIEEETAATGGGIFCVGAWTVDRAAGQMSDGDTTHHLRPKVMDLLVALADRCGEVLSKQELLNEVWRDVVVADGSLSVTVAELREALADDPGDPHYIETIPRRGYRLVAEVAPVEAQEPIARTVPPERSFGFRPVAWVAALGLLGLVLGYALISWRTAAPTPDLEIGKAPARIAVVPFENLTGDPGFDVLGRRAADVISQGLTELEEIDVVPQAEVAAAMADTEAIDGVYEMAAATRAGMVLTGVIVTTPEGLELQASLEDTIEHRIVRAFDPVAAAAGDSQRAAATLRDWTLIAVQDHLHPSLAFGARDGFPRVEAYRDYRKALSAFGARYESDLTEIVFPPGILQLEPGFERVRLRLAIGLTVPDGGDPSLANRMIQPLVESREQLSAHQQRILDAIEFRLEGRWISALRLLQEELERTPDDCVTRLHVIDSAARANHPRHVLAAFRDFSWDPAQPPQGAVMAIRQAANAYHVLGRHEEELASARILRDLSLLKTGLLWERTSELTALAAMGRFDEIDQTLSEALLERPFWPTQPGEMILDVARELRAHGHRERAEQMAQTALEWFQTASVGTSTDSAREAGTAHALALLDRHEEANAMYSEMFRLFPDSWEVWGDVGVEAARLGDTGTARDMMGRLAMVNAPYVFGAPTYLRACIAAQLGERDQALRLLREAIVKGFGDFVLLHRDPDLDALRDDPEFEELIRPKG